MRLTEIVWTPEVIEKIEQKHNVKPVEVEESCFDPSAHIRKARDGRYAVLGRTDAGRYLFVVGAYLGRGAMRIITARDMTASEQDLYQKHAI